MKKYIAGIIALICCFNTLVLGATVQQSHYQLSWSVSNYNGVDRLLFENSVNLDDSYLPYFTNQFNLAPNQEIDTVIIRDVVVVDFSFPENRVIKNSAYVIVDSIQLKTRYLTDKKQKKGLIYFLPIVYQNGQFKKIESFTLEYRVKTNPTFRSTKITGIHQFAPNSVLQNSKWVKIAVTQSGIHKITYADLVRWGIPNPANARVFGYGGALLNEDFSKPKWDDLPQLSVYKEKGADGVFNQGDYLLFYAQGPISWKYDDVNSKFVREINPYSFLGYYFISSDVGVEKTIDVVPPISNTPTVTVTSFKDYILYENETRNILNSGREWYGEEFATNPEYFFSFNFPNADLTQVAKIDFDVAFKAPAISSSYIGTTSMSAFINNESLGADMVLTRLTSGALQYASTGKFSYQTTPTSDWLQLKLKYNDTSVGKAWLNYISLNAYRNLIMYGNSMAFRNPDIVQAGQLAEYVLAGNSGLQLWDITNPTAIKQLPANYVAGQYIFLDSAEVLKEYLAINTSASFPAPQFIGDVSNQNLHALGQTDMVIITPTEFSSQAEILAQKHRTNDGISVLVLTPDLIYNEFSSGTPDASAFRWLMKMFYDRATTPENAPKSLLLFGDGTYDNRLIYSNTKNRSKLLTYQSYNSLHEVASYVTDDYFGFLDDDEDVNIQFGSVDIGIGRIPVSTTEQAGSIVAKITSYMDNSQKGYWKNRLAYIADDDDTVLHTDQSNQLVTDVEQKYPDFQPKRFFFDTYQQEEGASGESYPLAKEKFFNLFNSGLFFINYTGHSSIEGLSDEKIISRTDIADMFNKKLPFFVAASCNFNRYDDINQSGGEDFFLHPNGGVIASLASSRTSFAHNNFILNKELNKYLFAFENGKPLSLGEMVRRAKNGVSGDENKLNFSLLGDPALVLALPQNKVVVTEITSNSNVVADTIKALSTVVVKGQLQTQDAQFLSQFNGELTVAIYDKKMPVKTLGNESDSIYTFYDRTNMLFVGKTKVINGLFTVTFMVPKDIAYNYDTGRINMYAVDETNNLEAQGSFESFYVGGSKSDFVFENNGPLMSMYINSPEFMDNDVVDATPVFYANLSDENGINMVGGGIGHDLLLTLNNDPNHSFNLNDYYESSFGDYKSGQVVYEIPTLEDGSYSLSFRAWDLLNNSTTQQLNFRVKTGIEPTLYSLIAAPNPAETYVRFIFKHNQPLSKMTVTVLVYNLTGSLVWNRAQVIYSDTNTAIIDWDLTTDTGRKIEKGMYLYRIFVESEENSDFSTKTNKLLVR
ncbi:MAG: type IX secretion system sortase PorU [Paludibacteraceae bacterium]|nr:type IX secretion system sortase PorU [Paludibacteraceae bacterium]MBN2787470.1 type IX secretion system sortase PorU [Paludibacteraceae bacterium]